MPWRLRRDSEAQNWCLSFRRVLPVGAMRSDRRKQLEAGAPGRICCNYTEREENSHERKEDPLEVWGIAAGCGARWHLRVQDCELICRGFLISHVAPSLLCPQKQEGVGIRITCSVGDRLNRKCWWDMWAEIVGSAARGGICV